VKEKKEDVLISEGRKILEQLLLIFIVLKATGLINWSWWVVLSPFWVPAAIAFAAFVLWAIMRGIEERTNA
jgi:hypothetical protein